MRSYNNYYAPPLVGGYGYGGLGGYGYGGGLMVGGPTVFLGGGGLFNLIFLGFIATSVISAFRNAGSSNTRDGDDEFDDDF